MSLAFVLCYSTLQGLAGYVAFPCLLLQLLHLMWLGTRHVCQKPDLSFQTAKVVKKEHCQLSLIFKLQSKNIILKTTRHVHQMPDFSSHKRQGGALIFKLQS